MIRSLDDLSPATADRARRWLEASVAHLPQDYRDVVRDDLLGAMFAVVEAGMTPQELAAAVAPLAAATVPSDEEAGERTDGSRLVGTWWGIPYDLRPPTGERIRRSMWNPADPHLLRPRAFGVGWDLNVGALAVRLGLIEPDAEDVPFTVGETVFYCVPNMPGAVPRCVPVEMKPIKPHIGIPTVLPTPADRPSIKVSDSLLRQYR